MQFEKLFNLLIDAIKNWGLLEVEYIDSKGEQTFRTINPFVFYQDLKTRDLKIDGTQFAGESISGNAQWKFRVFKIDGIKFARIVRQLKTRNFPKEYNPQSKRYVGTIIKREPTEFQPIHYLTHKEVMDWCVEK